MHRKFQRLWHLLVCMSYEFWSLQRACNVSVPYEPGLPLCGSSALMILRINKCSVHWEETRDWQWSSTSDIISSTVSVLVLIYTPNTKKGELGNSKKWGFLVKFIHITIEHKHTHSIRHKSYKNFLFLLHMHHPVVLSYWAIPGLLLTSPMRPALSTYSWPVHLVCIHIRRV